MEVARVNAMVGRPSLFFGKISCLPLVDSTNTRLKLLAEEGAPEGTVLIAQAQSGGRGTAGRSFWSPVGAGLYLSVLLRPRAPVAELLTLTGRAATAVRRAIAGACGAPCAIKWLNDIYLNRRKVCGILAELGADYVVLGLGVNLTQTPGEFAAQGLGDTATSLAAEGRPVEGEALCAAILRELEAMYRAFPGGLEECLAEYRSHCLTLGRRVEYGPEPARRRGTAVDIDEDFALLVENSHGVEPVRTGRVELKEDLV